MSILVEEIAPFGDRLPCTYFIQPEAGGPIKIGKSWAGELMRKRLAGLQTGNPHNLVVTRAVLGNREEEFHGAFRGERIRGEWFLPSPALVSLARGKGESEAWQQVFQEGFNAAVRELSEFVDGNLRFRRPPL